MMIDREQWDRLHDELKIARKDAALWKSLCGSFRDITIHAHDGQWHVLDNAVALECFAEKVSARAKSDSGEDKDAHTNT